MTDPIPDTKAPHTRWMWVAVIVVLAIAAVIFFFNADGDEDVETVPDYATTTTEERLNQEIRPDADEDVSGMLDGQDATTDPNVIVADELEPSETVEPIE